MSDDRAGAGGQRGAAGRWLAWCLIFWGIAIAYCLIARWPAIQWFALSDTDDNLRIAQVRALLAGQGWFDLRMYKLDPPAGANVHWSRLVDLPIAGIILVAKLFVNGAVAEKAAVALAPMIPMLLAMIGAALAARRLVAPAAFALAIAIMAAGENLTRMWMPLRIDHHGWQLALLMVVVAGLADRKGARGGLVVGLASAVSFAIGLEMMPYLALAAAICTLRWVWDRAEALRLAAYGASLAGGVALGYAGFASYDNRALVCDALSPVYLSTLLFAGMLLFGLSLVKTEGRGGRLALAALAGGALAAGYALAWPQCLGAPEHLSPEVKRLWFNNIREAKPIYQHGWRTALSTCTLPAIGLIGAWLAVARERERREGWTSIALLSTTACLMLLWQTRAGPTAQLLAVPGATWLGWRYLLPLARHRNRWVRAIGPAAGYVLVSGLVASLVLAAIPPAPTKSGMKKVAAANRRCPTLPALAPIARLPAATILTFVDMGPRLIAVTHHRAIAGPYHRNGQAILDIHHAFREVDPAVARDVMRRHGATLILTCPGMSESTLYGAYAKRGFYMQLQRGQLPPWLKRMPLPQDSPFRLYRLREG